MKTYGPYREFGVTIDDPPKAYGNSEAYIRGINLPDLRVVANGQNSIVAFAGEGGAKPVPYADIYGVQYRLRLDLRRDEATGKWDLDKGQGNPTGWYSVTLSRANSWSTRDGSPAANKHVKDVIVPALAAWLASDEYKPVLSAGRARTRLEQIERAERELAKADAAPREAQIAVAAAYALPQE